MDISQPAADGRVDDEREQLAETVRAVMGRCQIDGVDPAREIVDAILGPRDFVVRDVEAVVARVTSDEAFDRAWMDEDAGGVVRAVLTVLGRRAAEPLRVLAQSLATLDEPRNAWARARTTLDSVIAHARFALAEADRGSTNVERAAAVSCSPGD